MDEQTRADLIFQTAVNILCKSNNCEFSYKECGSCTLLENLVKCLKGE
jgi:hypothetical protein